MPNTEGPAILAGRCPRGDMSKDCGMYVLKLAYTVTLIIHSFHQCSKPFQNILTNVLS